MKCRYCVNTLLPNQVTSGKIACQQLGCISHGINPRSKQFQVIVKGRSQQEVDDAWKTRVAKGVSTQRDNGYYADKCNNPGSKEFWFRRGLSAESVEAKLTEKNRASSATKKAAGFYDVKANNPFAKDYWIRRGESSSAVDARMRIKNHNCPEYWTSRGFSGLEAEKLAAASADTNSLQAKVRRHGMDGGTTKYAETKQRLSAAWSPRSAYGQKFGSSAQANRFFRRLYKYVRRLGYLRDDVMCDSNRGELYIRSGARIMFYDFCVRPLKLIIEFNGEHVHPNTDALSTIDFANWTHAYDKRSAQEVLEADQEKVYCAEEMGYNILSVWSKDHDNFSKATNFIRTHYDCQNRAPQCQDN